jgi:hypothetical protein
MSVQGYIDGSATVPTDTASFYTFLTDNVRA